MEPLVECIFEDPRWEEFGLEALAERAALATLAELDIDKEGFSISLLACDDTRIAVLNTDFRGKDKATNVLSWPSEERAAEEIGGTPDLPEPGEPDDPESLGDIAIAYETCQREAVEQEKTPYDHVMHLMVHGVLHLLGYDHIEDEDAELMEALEVRVLAKLGISDPY